MSVPGQVPVSVPVPDSAANAAAVTAAADPQQSAVTKSVQAVKAARTTVTVTLTPEAFAFFEAEAKSQHRSLPNYMFVKLQTMFEQEGHGRQVTASSWV